MHEAAKFAAGVRGAADPAPVHSWLGATARTRLGLGVLAGGITCWSGFLLLVSIRIFGARPTDASFVTDLGLASAPLAALGVGLLLGRGAPLGKNLSLAGTIVALLAWFVFAVIGFSALGTFGVILVILLSVAIAALLIRVAAECVRERWSTPGEEPLPTLRSLVLGMSALGVVVAIGIGLGIEAPGSKEAKTEFLGGLLAVTAWVGLGLAWVFLRTALGSSSHRRGGTGGGS